MILKIKANCTDGKNYVLYVDIDQKEAKKLLSLNNRLIAMPVLGLVARGRVRLKAARMDG